ncbi:MAG: branched-chain amino acid ABC transporter permease [Myxococcota bacterium]
MPNRPLVTRRSQELRWFADRWSRLGLALGLGLALTWPFVVSARWLTVGNQGLVAVVGALGLMVLTGFAGQVSLGHAAFLALGAYTVAGLGVHAHAPFWLALPAGGLVATVVGLAVGPFALRLRGLYLAIVTLGLLFVVDHTLLSLAPWTGGNSGTPAPMYWGFGGPSDALGDFGRSGPLSRGQQTYFLFAAIAAGCTAAVAQLRASRTGRALVAVRDSDLAAEALGVRPVHAKSFAFGASAFLGGLAGGMFAYQQQYLTVSPPFDLSMSVQYIAMCVLGGVGTTFGAVVGALGYVFLTPAAQAVAGELPLVSKLSSAQQSTLVFSVVVCAFLVFEPLGLYGIWLRVQRFFVGWPFRV